MNNLQLFDFNESNQSVRTFLDEHQEAWFCLMDICSILGLTNPSQVKSTLDNDDLSLNEVVDSKGRLNSTNFVTESGLYQVIFQSKKPIAKSFKKWITSEVIPSIRKTGSYSINGVVPKSFPDALRLYADEVEKKEKLQLENIQQQQLICEYQPKVDYYDTILQSKDVITITQIAKDYGLTAYQLNNILHDDGLQYKQSGQWLLYKEYADKGLTKSTTLILLKIYKDVVLFLYISLRLFIMVLPLLVGSLTTCIDYLKKNRQLLFVRCLSSHLHQH